MMLKEYLYRQMAFSRRTFGEGLRTEGICKHIESELDEIRAKPEDKFEWVDVIILAMDGYWRCGGDPAELMNMLVSKQMINFNRKWPAPGPEDTPSKHIREEDSVPVMSIREDDRS